MPTDEHSDQPEHPDLCDIEPLPGRKVILAWSPERNAWVTVDVADKDDENRPIPD